MVRVCVHANERKGERARWMDLLDWLDVDVDVNVDFDVGMPGHSLDGWMDDTGGS